MRFMMLVKASKESEAGVLPGEKILADMVAGYWLKRLEKKAKR